jgi:hypothetical protein
VIVARPASIEGPPQKREGKVMRIDELWRAGPAMTGPPFLAKAGVSLERRECIAVKEPMRFSRAFCTWLLIGGPLL